MTASHYGMPISTTHAITASIFGVGASKRMSAVRWQVAKSVVTAWVITIPATAVFGALVFLLANLAWP
jgi:PiT family inorganic phosphate transporter